jgi:myxalamid-type polyketide synthase MxaE and MxaD
LSIQWGPWRSTGLFSGDAAERNADELDRQGIHGFSPEEGVHVFTAIHGSDAPVVTVMPVDLAALRSARSGRDLNMFEGRWPVLSNAPAGEGGLGQLLAQASTPADRRMILIPLVKEIVGGVLKLAPSRLDTRRALGTMGLTSLMAMELRNRLEALAGRPLSATVAWNYPTIDALVGFLAQEAPSGVPPAPLPDAAAAIVEAVAPTAEMTDDDVADLLRRKPGVRTR